MHHVRNARGCLLACLLFTTTAHAQSGVPDATAVASATAPENLIQNPGFTSDLSSWDLFESFGVHAAWSMLDAAGSLASGSLRGTLPASGTLRYPIYASQCVAVQPNRPYVFGASVLLPSGSSPPGARARVFANTHVGVGCTLGFVSSVESPDVAAFDAWTVTRATIVAGANVGSIRVHLRVTASEGTLVSNFDDVFLQIEDAIFRDGFDDPVPAGN